jgi:peptidoglycan glycosyltransferase
MLTPGGFERRAAAAGVTGLAVVLVFFAVLAYWEVGRADLAEEETNPRVVEDYRDPGRGRILDREGNVLAESNPDGSRSYHDSSASHVLGYIDARYGSQGAELVFNAELSGQAPGSWSDAFDAEFRRQHTHGNDVRLTLDPAIQAAAAAGLGDRRGAVVALDPRNGEVLAMVSVPAYDPGSIAEHGEELVSDERSPLLNRASQGLYPPGSIFKTVTAISALENRVITPETEVTCPGELVFDGFPISCRNTSQGVGTYPFKHAFAFSVNAIFAQVGVDLLGWGPLTATAERLGFNHPLDFTLDTAPTQLHGPGTEESVVLLASTAFGQGELLVTPLQMAYVTAAIANNGVAMRPKIGLAVTDGDRVIRELEPPSGERLIDEQVARTLQDFMVAVMEEGQANVGNVGVAIGGKTGTAESGEPGVSHAWFIAFAPADDPVIAVAVIVERGGRGGEVASPIAGQVIRAALAR